MRLFRSPQLLSSWVACLSDGAWVRFPAAVDGWKQRSPYSGPLADLQQVAPWSAFNTGFPHPDAKLRSTRLSSATMVAAAAA